MGSQDREKRWRKRRLRERTSTTVWKGLANFGDVATVIQFLR
jgi:hypothetical protein